MLLRQHEQRETETEIARCTLIRYLLRLGCALRDRHVGLALCFHPRTIGKPSL